MRKLMLPMILLAMGTGPVLAADASLDAARRCGQVADSLQRLVCYDRLFAGPAAAPAAPSAAAPPAAGSPAIAAAPPAAAPAAAPRPVAPAVSAPPAAAPAAAGLGAEQVRTDRQRQPAEASSLQAKVVAVRETRMNVFRVTLDNEQTWQQQEPSTLFHVATGDTVQIDRGALGSYRMSRISGGGSGWVRVTRVN